MIGSPSNRIRSIGWLSVGAIPGLAITLLAFFAFSSFNGGSEHDRTNSKLDHSTSIADQDVRAPFYTSGEDSESSVSQVERPLDAVWNELVADEIPNVAQLSELVRVAKQWMDEAGFEFIQKINDSLTNSVVQNAVISSIVHHAAQSDAESALKQALRLSGPVRDLALRAVATSWVGQNPIRAMKAVSAIENGGVRREMLELLVRAWAENYPTDVLEDLELVPENLRMLGEREALLALARSDPQGTAALLGNISDPELKLSLTKVLASSWADLDVHAALEWAMSEDADIKDQVLALIVGKLARKDPEFALQTALSQPAEDTLVGMELVVIGEVAAIDLELAVEMLSQVREGLTKFLSYATLGKYLVRNNEIDRVHGLGLELPEDEREAYYNQIVHQWSASHPESLVEQLDNLPSTGNKYQAAMSLVRRNAGTNVLTKSQMEYVRGFLPEDYNSETGRRNRPYSDPGLTEEQTEKIRAHFIRVVEERTGKSLGEKPDNGPTERVSVPL